MTCYWYLRPTNLNNFPLCTALGTAYKYPTHPGNSIPVSMMWEFNSDRLNSCVATFSIYRQLCVCLCDDNVMWLLWHRMRLSEKKTYFTPLSRTVCVSARVASMDADLVTFYLLYLCRHCIVCCRVDIANWPRSQSMPWRDHCNDFKNLYIYVHVKRKKNRKKWKCTKNIYLSNRLPWQLVKHSACGHCDNARSLVGRGCTKKKMHSEKT